MSSYYNEFDPYAAQWLRNLIAAGEIPAGDVDERSISEVSADDLKKYTQCHFFAGIGGWPLALRLANWPDDRPVWTGSCPCQPFSSAGKQKGKLDDRHLWPVWFRLIRECRPPVVFGEQVAAAITHGWWDDVASDMEGEGYACGAAVLPACSVGKPHKRDRLWFVGYSEHDGRDGRQVAGGDATAVRDDAQGSDCASQSSGTGEPCDVGNAFQPRLEGLARDGHGGIEPGWDGAEAHGSVASSDTLEWLQCPDGKQRPVKPGIRLLAHGFPNRVAALKAGGNAIVPEEAAAFIVAFGG